MQLSLYIPKETKVLRDHGGYSMSFLEAQISCEISRGTCEISRGTRKLTQKLTNIKRKKKTHIFMQVNK